MIDGTLEVATVGWNLLGALRADEALFSVLRAMPTEAHATPRLLASSFWVDSRCCGSRSIDMSCSMIVLVSSPEPSPSMLLPTGCPSSALRNDACGGRP